MCAFNIHTKKNAITIRIQASVSVFFPHSVRSLFPHSRYAINCLRLVLRSQDCCFFLLLARFAAIFSLCFVHTEYVVIRRRRRGIICLKWCSACKSIIIHDTHIQPIASKQTTSFDRFNVLIMMMTHVTYFGLIRSPNSTKNYCVFAHDNTLWLSFSKTNSFILNLEQKLNLLRVFVKM